MKSSIFIIILSLLMPCFAQDVIYLRSGKTIEANVLTVNSIKIEYKIYTNQDGPVYSIRRTELEKIIYQNGSTDVFQKESSSSVAWMTSESTILNDNHRYYLSGNLLTKDTLKTILANCPDSTALALYNESVKTETASKIWTVLAPTSGILAYLGFFIAVPEISKEEVGGGTALFVTSGIVYTVSMISSISLNNKYKRLRDKAVRVYNNNL